MKVEKDKLELIFSAVSVFLAALALIISIRSCSQAERATVIAEKDFLSSRTATWTLEITQNDSNRVKSVDDEVVLQKAFMHFPPGFGVSATVIKSPDFDIPFPAKTAIVVAMSQIDDLRTKFMLNNVVSSVPVVIESWYVAKGESFRDRSMYSLEFRQEASSNSDELSINTIDLSGLSFARRLNPDDNVRDVLQSEWDYYLSL